jgi:hypothetical protein
MEHEPVVFRGKCCGVKLRQRYSDDKHIIVSLQIEDDGNWIDQDYSISSHWLDELIRQLGAAKSYFKSEECEKDPSGYGYRFKEEE